MPTKLRQGPLVVNLFSGGQTPKGPGGPEGEVCTSEGGATTYELSHFFLQGDLTGLTGLPIITLTAGGPEGRRIQRGTRGKGMTRIYNCYRVEASGEHVVVARVEASTPDRAVELARSITRRRVDYASQY